MNSIRKKLTLALFGTSFVAIGVVGITARFITLRRFNEVVVDRAFQVFRQDVLDYYQTYGSWEEAVAGEPFAQFVARIHQGVDRPAPAVGDGDAPRRPVPGASPRGPRGPRLPLAPVQPPRFLVVDSAGRVLMPIPGYGVGDILPARELRDRRPLYLGARFLGFAVAPVPPALTELERRYLSTIRSSWEYSLLLACGLAIPVGLLMGGQLAEPLREMTRAIRDMGGGKLRQRVTVRSSDEVGQLAETFNRMSSDLADVYDELERSNVRITEQAKRLEELSRIDELTGLFNRRSFNDTAGRLFDQARRYGHPLTMAMVDIDRFKAINDRYSHAVGDAVLRAVADLLKSSFRSVDVVARYGGEEFAVAFPETTLEQATPLAERLRRAMHDHHWASVAPGLSVTVSAGLSDIGGHDSLESVLQAADGKLYESKNAGRDRVSW